MSFVGHNIEDVWDDLALLCQWTGVKREVLLVVDEPSTLTALDMRIWRRVQLEGSGYSMMLCECPSTGVLTSTSNRLPSTPSASSRGDHRMIDVSNAAQRGALPYLVYAPTHPHSPERPMVSLWGRGCEDGEDAQVSF